MRKVGITVMMCVIGALMIASCGREDDSGTIAGGTGEGDWGTELTDDTKTDAGIVSLTVWAEGVNFDVLNKMIESFKAAHFEEAEFDIQLVEAADADTKGHLLMDVHNGADVFPIADDQLPSIVAGGAVVPVPNAEEIARANFDEAVEAASVNGTLYAYPMTADNGYFLYYNKDYFTEEDVKTMDGILAVCEASEKKFTMDWSSGWYLYSFFGNTGMEFGINDDGVTNYCNWNTTEGAIRGVDVAEAMLAIAVHPGFEARTDFDFMTGVRDGSVIAGVSGVWNAVSIRDAWGDDYGAVKLPTYTVAGEQVQMSSFVGYKMLGVNAYSEHVDWALALADWMTNEQNQTLYFEERSQGPSNRNAAASDTVSQVPAIAAVIDQAQYGVLQRVGNHYWDPMTEFGNVLAAGNPSRTDLQELLDTMVEGVTASTTQ